MATIGASETGSDPERLAFGRIAGIFQVAWRHFR
jgi:hypothetical protein